MSDFGYDPIDSTRFVQQALDSGSRHVILDRQAGPWHTLPLRMRSDVTFELEPGVELVAKRGAYKGLRDFLFWVDGVTNATIRGGAGSAFRIWKKDYQGPDYKHGEWRYALKITRSANILVEGLRICDSGGDGIGVSGKNITIRNCVCDNNHRQGISVFDVDGLLIEDTVLSNTCGTMPQSGIDFEPDRNGWRMSDVTMRNCRFENNAGCGIEIHLAKLKADAPPISMRFENCRTVGNRTSLAVLAGAGASDHVGGVLSFSNCVFASAASSGIALSNKTGDSFDVRFSDCTVTNVGGSAVSLSVSTADLSGPPDGIDFGDLTVFAGDDGPWFKARRYWGPSPQRLSGTVTVVGTNGVRRVERMDADWISRNLPLFNGGVLPPPRAPFLSAEKVTVVDDCPGELADLSPVASVKNHRRYVFFAEKKGPVRFVARQATSVAGRTASAKPLLVQSVRADGSLGSPVKVPQPGLTSGDVVFKARKRGFYVMTVQKGGTRFLLEKSSVPVALDVRELGATVAGVDARPFALWAWVPESSRFCMLAGGSDYSRFRFRVTDPSGRERLSKDEVCDLMAFAPQEATDSGLWQLDFAKAKAPHYEFINVDLTGIPGVYFLSDKKYWK